MDRYPTVEVLAVALVEEAARLMQPLGLSLRAERLSGIGKYTAGSICAHAFGHPAVVLDDNVARIVERFFGLQGERVKSRCKIQWSAADIITPKQGVSRWNLTLLDFGAMVCTAKQPSCGECPLQEKCYYFANARSQSKIRHLSSLME